MDGAGVDMESLALGSGLGVNWLIDGGGLNVESARLCYTAIAAGWEW